MRFEGELVWSLPYSDGAGAAAATLGEMNMLGPGYMVEEMLPESPCYAIRLSHIIHS